MGQQLVLENSTRLLITPLSGLAALTLTPYSARGLSQTLEPITGVSGGGSALGSWLRRDINLNLVDVSDIRARKYNSIISCRDTETPSLDGAWIGERVLVQCACELNFPVGGTPQRPVVPGSLRTVGNTTFYRPEIEFMLAALKNSHEEYRADYAWQAHLSEV